MGILCAAYDCRNTYKKPRIGLSFHKFPLKNKELLGKWLSAIRREKFVPTQHHKICSEHFTESCFWKTNGKRILKDDAVPTIFSFSHHNKKTEEPPQKILIKEAESEKVNSINQTHKILLPVSKVNSINQTHKILLPVSITEEHNYALNHSEAVQKIKHEIKRKDVIISSLRNDIIKYKQKCNKQDCIRRKLKTTLCDLKEKTLINEHALRALNDNLPGIMIDIVSASGEQNSEYSEALKQFAKSVYFESPPAYEYVRQSLCKALPQANMVRKWMLNESSDETVIPLEDQV